MNYRITPGLRQKFRYLGTFGTSKRITTLSKLLDTKTDIAFMVKFAVLDQTLTMLHEHENVATVRGQIYNGYVEFLVTNQAPKKVGNWLMLCG